MKKNKGYSLVEIMVTLAIISFGLLGIAGIVVNSLKNTHLSHARTQAILLANDIIDRMRANRTTAEHPSSPYHLPMHASAPVSNGIPHSDLMQWRKRLATSLPGGKGSVMLDPSTKKVTVTVQWTPGNMGRGKSEQHAQTQVMKIETRL